MAKKAPKATSAVYVAKVRRNEINGDYYHVGDRTSLDGLTPEQIAFVLSRLYYVPEDWANVPKAVKDVYDTLN